MERFKIKHSAYSFLLQKSLLFSLNSSSSLSEGMVILPFLSYFCNARIFARSFSVILNLPIYKNKIFTSAVRCLRRTYACSLGHLTADVRELLMCFRNFSLRVLFFFFIFKKFWEREKVAVRFNLT